VPELIHRHCRKCGLEWLEMRVSLTCPNCGRRLPDTNRILLRQSQEKTERGKRKENNG
jgi:uncharacterized Zn finger protein (UPF0148 family)